MTTPEPSHGISTVVFGLGQTGYSVARYLSYRGEAVSVVDTRIEPPYADRLRQTLPEVSLSTLDNADESLLQAQRIALSPGVDPRLPILQKAREAGVEIIGDIELFARASSAPVIAITGSNGKSTVTALTGELCRASGRHTLVGGNIGTPALDLLVTDKSVNPDFYVLELSSFQLETTYSLQPTVATILNLSADHLDRYVDFAAYASAKARIFRDAKKVLVNRSDAAVMALASSYPNAISSAISFGDDESISDDDFGIRQIDGKKWLVHGSKQLLAVKELQIAGTHNALNVLAALALVSLAGIQLDESVITAVKAFRGLPHRCEVLGEYRGARWINDSKGTNVGATLAAMQGIGKPLMLIAGGQGKGADFTPLALAARQYARAVVVFGEDAELIEQTMIETLGDEAPVYRVRDLQTAVKQAAAASHPGDNVLFSPACASFDMFENYVQRGDAFRRIVEALA